MGLLNSLGFLTYQLLRKRGGEISRNVIDEWLEAAVRDVRNSSLQPPQLKGELLREKSAQGVKVLARISTIGPRPRVLSQNQWQGTILCPELQKAFGMNHRIELRL